MKQNRFWTKVGYVMLLRDLRNAGDLKGLSLSKIAKLVGVSSSNSARQVQLYLRDIPELELAEKEVQKFHNQIPEKKEEQNGL